MERELAGYPRKAAARPDKKVGTQKTQKAVALHLRPNLVHPKLQRSLAEDF
jgi:hypothetical protein